MVKNRPQKGTLCARVCYFLIVSMRMIYESQIILYSSVHLYIYTRLCSLCL